MKKVLLCVKDTNYSKHCHRYIFEKKQNKIHQRTTGSCPHNMKCWIWNIAASQTYTNTYITIVSRRKEINNLNKNKNKINEVYRHEINLNKYWFRF